jgi:flavin-dependent dehydrogenase
MGSTVETVRSETGAMELTVRRGSEDEKHSSRAIVVASGVNPAITGALGLGNVDSYLVGAHARVQLDALPETEVYLMSHVERGAFGWVVPLGNGHARVGALAPRNAREVLSSVLEYACVNQRLRTPVGHVARRPVPISPLKRGYGDRVVVIGDALGAVKPTTGGGLYFGALSALSAVSALAMGFEKGDLSGRSLAAHDAQWKAQLNTEMRRGRLLRRAYTRMNPRMIDRVIAAAARTGVSRRLVSDASFSFDRHTAVLIRGLIEAFGVSLVPAAVLRGLSRE